MPVPSPPAAPAGAVRARAALVVDVDGVVSAVHPQGDAWGDEVTAGQFFGPVRVSPTLCRRLDELAALEHVVPLWLTSWAPETRARMDPFPGSNWATLATPEDVPVGESGGVEADPDGLDWWKWDALRAWLHAHPDIQSVVWCEDHLALATWTEDEDEGDAGAVVEPQARTHLFEADPDDAPFRTTVADVIAVRLALRGIAATLIAPQTAVGLTPENLDRVEAVLRTSA